MQNWCSTPLCFPLLSGLNLLRRIFLNFHDFNLHDAIVFNFLRRSRSKFIYEVNSIFFDSVYTNFLQRSRFNFLRRSLNSLQLQLEAQNHTKAKNNTPKSKKNQKNDFNFITFVNRLPHTKIYQLLKKISSYNY